MWPTPGHVVRDVTIEIYITMDLNLSRLYIRSQRIKQLYCSTKLSMSTVLELWLFQTVLNSFVQNDLLEVSKYGVGATT